MKTERKSISLLQIAMGAMLMAGKLSTTCLSNDHYHQQAWLKVDKVDGYQEDKV